MLAAVLAGTLVGGAAWFWLPAHDVREASRPAAASPLRLSAPVERYVALGDSFTAGPLIPYVDRSRTACLRSSANYPAVLAGWLRAETVVDVSCSGADSTDLVGRQLDAVTTATDLVTIGIGRNDFGIFGAVVSRCPALAAADPTGAPCRDAFTLADGTDGLLSRMGRLEQRLIDLLAEVGRRAPDAVVAVVGYPRLVPARGRSSGRTCPELPFAVGDYRWADRVERALNATLARAAGGSGTSYVDTYRGSRGHDACAGDAAWVNGQGSVPTRALAYHPYAEGMVASAAVAYETVTGRHPTGSMLRQAERLAQRRPPGTLTLRGQRVIAALLGASAPRR